MNIVVANIARTADSHAIEGVSADAPILESVFADLAPDATDIEHIAQGRSVLWYLSFADIVELSLDGWRA